MVQSAAHHSDGLTSFFQFVAPPCGGLTSVIANLDYVTSHLNAALLRCARTRTRHAALSPREQEILGWIVGGKSNGVIAQLLGISPSTVKFHLTHVYEKLNVMNRSQAVAWAARQG